MPVSLPPRVLIADDNADAVDVTVLLLETMGAQARGALDTTSALAEVAAFRPDVLIADLQMPDIGGVALARQARVLLPGLRVWALTGLDAVAVAAASGDAFERVLQKPLEADELQRLLGLA